MNELLTGKIPAARNNGAEWMQILVIVVVAVIYALGSILKAKANKAKQEEKQLAGKPARKPPEATRRLQPRRPAGPAPSREYRPQVQPPRRKVARPQPAVEFPAKKEEAILPPTLEPLAEPKLPPSVLPKELRDKQLAVFAETAQPEAAIEPLLAYADTDELKRAILYYEILGKPLSLRAPSEKIIGL